jgi:hypothetical protein
MRVKNKVLPHAAHERRRLRQTDRNGRCVCGGGGGGVSRLDKVEAGEAQL